MTHAVPSHSTDFKRDVRFNFHSEWDFLNDSPIKIVIEKFSQICVHEKIDFLALQLSGFNDCLKAIDK